MDTSTLDDPKPSSHSVRQGRPLRLRTGLCSYIFGLCLIWGDRFIYFGFSHPKTYLWVVLFFVGVPIASGLLVGLVIGLFRHSVHLKCLQRGFAWSFTVFGLVLVCLTMSFWVERLFRAPAVRSNGVAIVEGGDQNVQNGKTSFERLLQTANDFDLVNGTFVRIGDRYGHRIAASQYTAEERVIMLVWHSSGIIDNGGFEYLFSGDFEDDPEFRITAEAYNTAGLARGYEAFKEAFTLFPNGQIPHDSEVRIRQYRLANESVREAINTKHWKDGWEGLREKNLAQYIRQNAHKFRNLDPRE